MILFNSVSKTYAKSAVKAIDNMSLEIPGGKIFGFLGPNGAGKTTAIKMLTGVLRPDSGEIKIGTNDVVKDSMEARRNIGYVSDNPEVFTKLKAIEYLNFLGDVFGIDTATRRERISHYSGLFGIEDVLNASIGSFSHGMKQKLIITGSLLHDPDNWILDEPMVGLDPKSSFLLKEIMSERARDGKLVFFSTHIMEVAERLCDMLAIINKGKIIFTGNLAELRTRAGEDGTLEKLFLELVDDGEETA